MVRAAACHNIYQVKYTQRTNQCKCGTYFNRRHQQRDRDLRSRLESCSSVQFRSFIIFRRNILHTCIEDDHMVSDALPDCRDHRCHISSFRIYQPCSIVYHSQCTQDRIQKSLTVEDLAPELSDYHTGDYYRQEKYSSVKALSLDPVCQKDGQE